MRWRDFMHGRFLFGGPPMTDEEKQQIEAALRDVELPEGYEVGFSGEVRIEPEEDD